MAVIGINPKHPPMYKALGYQVHELGQYYLTNPEMSQNLIQKPDNISLATALPGLARLKKIDLSDLENMQLPFKSSSFKTIKYFKKRFIFHPFYHLNYTVFILMTC